MLINPSILILLLLIIKLVASSDNLAGHFIFIPTADYAEYIDELFEKYRHFWSGVSSVQAIRDSLEAGEKNLVERILKELSFYELNHMLDGVLHPFCTQKMFETLKRLRFGQSMYGEDVVQMYIFIHQPWIVTESELASISYSGEGRVFLAPAKLLAEKAFRRAKFAIVMKVFNACSQEYLEHLVYCVLDTSLIKRRHKFIALARAFILNDPDDTTGTRLLGLLGREWDPVSQDFIELLEHPSVGSQQFAKIIKETLKSKFIEKSDVRALVHVADPSDLPALKEHIKSEKLQKKLLQYLDVETHTNLDSAWSSVKPKKNNRLEKWYRSNAGLILKQLESMDLLLKVLYPLILEYLV